VQEIFRAVEGAWDSILQLLSKIIIPDWNDVIGWLPLLVLLGLVGPILSLLMLAWLYHFITRPRFHVRVDDPEPVQAERGPDGYFTVPPNVPYCPREGLIYPARARRCSSCRQELVVRCPVDSTVRIAGEETCRSCGTKYVLGAGRASLVVRRTSEPPEGGAAVA
jgi:hypothetical protein